MKKNSLKGFGIVFKYNLALHMKQKKYVISTVLIGLIFLLGLLGLMFYLTKNNSENEFTYNVETVYVVDETGMGVPEYAMMAKAMGLSYGMDTEFIVSDTSPKELIKNEEVEYIIVQKIEDDKFVIDVISGENPGVKKKQINKNLALLGDLAKNGFQNYIYMNSGMSQEQLMQALLPVVTNVEKIGAENQNKDIIVFAASFVFMMVIYFIVLIYGVGVCTDVPMEKTSKLVEQLLMSVSAYALIMGKILSKSLACIIQFVIWIICIVIGIFGGDALARTVYKVDNSMVKTLNDMLRQLFEGNAFTFTGVLLTIAISISGLLIYLVLAGLAGSFLTKPDQAGNVQMIFVLPLLVAFFYIFATSGISSGQVDISLGCYLVPFTGAMVTPAAVLLGILPTSMAVLSLVISIASSMLILYLAAKVYEGLLFFTGNKLKAKDVIAIFKKR